MHNRRVGVSQAMPTRHEVWERPWPLVGRDRILDLFTQAVRHRRVQGVLIHGPAGVGKTRLAEACRDRAEKAGLTTHWVVATAAAAAVPLGAVGHVIPPGVDLSDPVAGFAAVAAALGRGGEDRVVLLIDDLHLLDATSVMLVRQLMDSGSALLIGTVRTGEPYPMAAAFGTGDAIHRVDVEAFTEEQVAQVLASVLGGSVSARTSHEMYADSAGNALYLRELVLGALSSGALNSDGEVWQLAPGPRTGTPRLRELIAARLSRVSEAGTAVLELLALCEPVALADAQAVARLHDLVELERLGCLKVVKEGRRHLVMLAHPLYGEVVREGIAELRRRTILLDQAARLEARGARRQDDALHVTSWRLTATGTADPRRLHEAAALARHSHDYPQVVRLIQALPASAHTVRDRLLLADALFELGRPEEAENELERASSLSTTEHERLAVVAAYCVNALWGMAQASKALRMIDAGRGELPSPESLAVLAINEGCILAACGQPTAGLAFLDVLEDDAGATSDMSVWLFAAAVRTRALQMTGRLREAQNWAERAHATHRRVSRLATSAPHPAIQRAPAVLATAEAGDIHEARALGRRLFGELVRSEAGLPRMWVAYFLARVEWLAGHAAGARRWNAECVAIARSHHGTRPMRDAMGSLAASMALVGDTGPAAAELSALDRADADMAELEFMGLAVSPGRALGEAWHLAATGHLAQARATLLHAAEGLGDSGNLSAEGMLLVDVARLGGARDVADRLARIAARSEGALATVHADFAAALDGDDPEWLMRTSQRLEDTGSDLAAAEAAAAAAGLFRRQRLSRRATAAALRCRGLAERCEGAHTPLLATVDVTVPLTRRQSEIARLAAAGATSQEIADRLVLSIRTVDNHLAQVYGKLGVTGRRDLAHALGTR
ncbi:LuxR C-terminal-related transcriptional regulator [Streptomyces tirandamycinicus]|uniref:LuxR C-terminal-related transcriptional regulator n=1 Tax=Streptomyces tirandamycinicus TaxID=2174846 RepID=UPI00226F4A92|nr:LuxR family transcriptional regulator [Streptomyces tirandamycinicus]MCY0984518.1 LuxR C-terminal-related transcriptional regulator [Streptomyces tirandamycinicus]